jgi:hypothetical protein
MLGGCSLASLRLSCAGGGGHDAQPSPAPKAARQQPGGQSPKQPSGCKTINRHIHISALFRFIVNLLPIIGIDIRFPLVQTGIQLLNDSKFGTEFCHTIFEIILEEITMSNDTVPYNLQMACSQPNIAIPPLPFLPTINPSLSFCAISDYVPNAEIILSSCCDPDSTPSKRSDNVQSQAHSAVYDAENCAWRYYNVTGQNVDSSFESYLNRTSSASLEGKCFSSNSKVATSEGSSIYWKFGKKKKTVSAALLIALGVAGIVIG